MEAASIRYKNPGAMWGRTGKRPSANKEVATNAPIPLRWGSTTTFYLSDGMGQGNNIAVFPTFVQGICAQLDLWRSSPKYKNKRFADAIAVWSGGNYVESYIKYVCDRVPGMTRDTIMDDTFWRGPMGVGFLKAQAGHEAGQRYPAPDADWVEAQRCVFTSAPSPVYHAAAAQEDPRPGMAAHGDARLYDNQVQLKLMNYNPGGFDGLWGGGTAGALAGFFNDYARDEAVPLQWQDYTANYERIDSLIDKAVDEGFRRPVTEARAAADPKVVERVAPEIVPAKRGLWATISGFFTALGTTIYKGGEWLLGYQDQAERFGIMGYIDKVPPFVWFALGTAAIGAVVFFTLRTVRGIEKPVTTGERM